MKRRTGVKRNEAEGSSTGVRATNILHWGSGEVGGGGGANGRKRLWRRFGGRRWGFYTRQKGGFLLALVRVVASATALLPGRAAAW